MRASTNMRRVRKGDKFVVNGVFMQAMGFADRLDDGRVKVPVLVDGNDIPSRRIFDADLRVTLEG